MHHSEQLGVTIPKQLLEELAEVIAGKVAAHLEDKMHQIVPTSPVPPAKQEPKSRPTFLQLGEVAERVGFSRSTIYNKMSDGKFPQSVKLGERCVAWRLADLEAWEQDPAGYTCPVMQNP